MELPTPIARLSPAGPELMPHQAQVVAAAAAGHRTFLLADEPGLGKTAQALLAAQAATPTRCWRRPERREDQLGPRGRPLDPAPIGHRDPRRRRHRRWLRRHRRASTTRSSTATSAGSATSASAAWSSTRPTSSRTRAPSARSTSSRSPADPSRTARPLLMALTGTPLINDIEDFRAIWQFLGWIEDSKPLAELVDALEETGLTPPTTPSTPRRVRRDRPRHRPPPQGRRRRRHPGPSDRRPPGRARRRGRALDPRGRAGARQPAGRRYEAAMANRPAGAAVEGIDHELVPLAGRS